MECRFVDDDYRTTQKWQEIQATSVPAAKLAYKCPSSYRGCVARSKRGCAYEAQ